MTTSIVLKLQWPYRATGIGMNAPRPVGFAFAPYSVSCQNGITSSPVVCSVTIGMRRSPEVSYACNAAPAAFDAWNRCTWRLRSASSLDPEYHWDLLP